MSIEKNRILIGPDEGDYLPLLDIVHKVTANLRPRVRPAGGQPRAGLLLKEGIGLTASHRTEREESGRKMADFCNVRTEDAGLFST